MPKLEAVFARAIRAGWGGCCINSYEPEDAMRTIHAVCRDQKEPWLLMTWDPLLGLCLPGQPPTQDPSPDPLKALAALRAVRQNPHKPEDGPRGVLVLRNMLQYVTTPAGLVHNPVILEALQRTIAAGADQRYHVVLLGYDSIKLPPELQKVLYTIDHDRPDAGERWGLLQSVSGGAVELPDDMDDPVARRIMDASAGLTRAECLGAFADMQLSNSLDPEILWAVKAKLIGQGGFLEMLGSGTRVPGAPYGFDRVAGLDGIKAFCLEMFNDRTRHLSNDVRPRGLTLLGPPGVGKTLLSSALGEQIGWPTFRLDIGRLMGGLVGATESNTRQALATIDAAAPAIVVIDEIDRALAGSSGGSHDSGVGSRLLGSLLTWMNDRQSQTFVVFTGNNIEHIDPALLRAERIDGVFMFDLPSPAERNAAWEMYIRFFEPSGLTEAQTGERPEDTDWTPAEIKSCCRRATLTGSTLLAAAEVIIPTAKTYKDEVQKVRAWADGRCLAASYRGVYRTGGDPAATVPTTTRRRVARASSTN